MNKMNKKYLFGIFFISFISLSIITPNIRADTNYSFPIPKEGKGMSSIREVKIYDEDIWKDSVGTKITKVFKGDYDIVGAQSKKLLKDWEKQDYKLVLLMLNQLEMSGSSIYDALDFLNNTIAIDLSGLVGGAGSIATGSGGVGGLNVTLLNIAGSLSTGIIGESYIKEKYDMKTEGAIVTVDIWETTSEDFKEKPDDKDVEAPFVKDPHDIYELYKDYTAFFTELKSTISSAATLLDSASAAIVAADFNDTLSSIMGIPVVNTLNLTRDGFLESIAAFAQFTKKEFLIGLFLKGFPTYNPQDKYLDTIIEDFDVDDFKVRGNTVRITMEEDDASSKLGVAKDDYTIEVTYSDHGSVSSTIFKDEDGTIFFEETQLDFVQLNQIPISLGVGAIAVLGVIYVVRRKLNGKKKI